jgi:4'-phosphopantetheinyl transferase
MSRVLRQIREGEVHLWRAWLDVDARVAGRLAETLDLHERGRAARLRPNLNRARYVAGRGMLREILAEYVGAAPQQLEFQYNEFGKPAVGGAHMGCGIQFNLTHSGAMALLAVGVGRRVGVDVENRSVPIAVLDLARRYFAASETAALRSLPAPLRQHAFYRCWTRKEAFIKARGCGLSQPLDSFAVTVGPDEPARLLDVQPIGEIQHWHMIALPVGSDFEAALVVEGADCRVAPHDWVPS